MRRVLFVVVLFFFLINSQQIYVNPNNGNDNSTCGSLESPCKSIPYSIGISSNNSVIILEAATYQLESALQVISKNNLTIESSGMVIINAENGFLHVSNSDINLKELTINSQSYLITATNNSLVKMTSITIENTQFSQTMINLQSSTMSINELFINNDISINGSFINSCNSVLTFMKITGKNVKLLSDGPFIYAKDGLFAFDDLELFSLDLNNQPFLKLDNIKDTLLSFSTVQNIVNASSVFEFDNSTISLEQFQMADVSCAQSVISTKNVQSKKKKS